MKGPMAKYGKRVSDWMKLACGDRVVERADVRHVGRVEAIARGYEAKVCWDNGLISYVRCAI